MPIASVVEAVVIIVHVTKHIKHLKTLITCVRVRVNKLEDARGQEQWGGGQRGDLQCP